MKILEPGWMFRCVHTRGPPTYEWVGGFEFERRQLMIPGPWVYTIEAKPWARPLLWLLHQVVRPFGPNRFSLDVNSIKTHVDRTKPVDLVERPA